MYRKVAILTVCGLLIGSSAWAGNGHFLHGIGAINSSMGGAGVALATDPLSAVHANPALITKLAGTQAVMSTEFFKPTLSMTTRGTKGFDGLPPELVARLKNNTTDSKDELGVLPAVAWSHKHSPDSKFTFAGGLLAAAGFRTAWPVDPNSLVLAPQPRGFGRLQTELAVTKYPLAVGYQATEDLALGVQATLWQGRLIIQPLPVVTPDCQDRTGKGTGNFGSTTDGGDCASQVVDGIVTVANDTISTRPGTSGPVSSWAPSIQVGVLYEPMDMVSVGLSFTSGANFDDYVWQSSFSNPYVYDETGQFVGQNPLFGQPREISIDVDGPPILSFGLGLHPSEQLSIALDGRWVGYKDTNGIGEPTGVGLDQSLTGIGWQDIWIGMLGAQYILNKDLTLRGGLNFNQSPIKDEFTLNAGGTPSTFTQHYTAGASYAISENFFLDLGFYYTPEATKTGPIYDSTTWNFEYYKDDPNITKSQRNDWEVDLSNGIISGLAAFNFRF